MVVKRFISIALAGLMVVTSINAGGVKAFASENDLDVISITESADEANFEDIDILEDLTVEEQQLNETAEDAKEEASEDALDEEKENVSVTLNASGGLFENDEETLEFIITKGGTLSETIDPPLKDGFKFDGWFLDEELTQAVDISSYEFTDNAVLFAKWQEISTEVEPEQEEVTPDKADDYSFTLDANGGKFSNGETTYKITWKTTGLSSYKPTLEGKYLKGWYADKECTQLLSKSDDPTSYTYYQLNDFPENGATLYAGWADPITITFEFGRETGTNPLTDTGYYWEQQKANKQMEYTIPAGGTITWGYYPSNTYYYWNSDYHYTFDAWYTDFERTQEHKVSDITKERITKDTTYYAGYVNNRYVVTFHSLDTTGYFTTDKFDVSKWSTGMSGKYDSMAVCVTDSGYGYISYSNIKSYIKNTNPRRAIDSFYYDKDKTKPVDFDDDLDVKSDLDIYIEWNNNNKIVTFDANDGENAFFFDSDNKTDMSVHKKEIGNVPTEDEYDEVSFYPGTLKNKDLHKRFAGWSTDKDSTDPEFPCTDEYGSKNISIPLTDDITYYAIWVNAYHVVTFDAGKGSFTYYDSLTGENEKRASIAQFRTNLSNNRLNYHPSDYYVESGDENTVFEGWYIGTERIEEYLSYVEFDNDTTVTAKYVPVYTVTFEAGNGTFSYYNDKSELVKDVNTASFKTNKEGKLNRYPSDVVSKDSNKVFQGWFNGDEYIEYVGNYVFTEDTTLTAHYTLIYSITFDAGTGTFSYYDYDLGETVENVSKHVFKTNKNGKLDYRPRDVKPADDKTLFQGWVIGDEVIDLYDYVFTEDTTVTARYIPIYTITIKGNGGTFDYYNYNEENYQKHEGATEAVLQTDKDGEIRGSVYEPKVADGSKVFKCWYNETKKEEIEYLYSYVFSEDTTVIATYATVYSVTIDGNGGTFTYRDYSVEDSSEATGTKVVLKTEGDGTIDGWVDDPVIDDDSKIFTGWYIGSTKVDSLSSYVFTADTTVTAKYGRAFTLTLNANGGYFYNYSTKQNETTKIVKVVEGENAYLDTPKYENSAKEFGGWYLDKDTWKQPVDRYEYVPTANKTLYARWLDRFTVTFDMGEGTLNGETKAEYKIIEGATFGSSYSVPSNPTPNDSDNKAFEGWYKDQSLSQKIEREEIISYVVNSDVTFYAKYANAYTITFNANSGSFVNKSGTTYSVKVAEGKAIKGNYPTVKSTQEKVFRGWFTDKECTDDSEVKNIYSYVPTGNVTFYAGYTECYILTFKANHTGAKLDGSTKDVVVKITKGDAYRYGKDTDTKDVLFSAPKLTYDGITDQLPIFIDYNSNNDVVGWATNAEGTGNQYYFGTSQQCYVDEKNQTHYFNMYGFIPTESMTFYACWGDPVEVTYDSNGGTFKDYDYYDKYYIRKTSTTRVLKVAKGTIYENVRKPSTGSYYITPPEGYKEYCEWGYTDKDGKNHFGYNKKITENTTFYAKWDKESGGGSSEDTRKTLTLHSGKGYFGSRSDTTETIKYTPNKTETHYTQIPVIDEYAKAFSGWFYDEALTKPYPADYQYQDGLGGNWYIVIPAEVTDLYAGYGTAYTLTLDANGGYFDNNDDRTKDPKDLKEETIIQSVQKCVGSYIEVSELTMRVRRDGDKVFGGWYTDKDCKTKAAIVAENRYYEYYKPTSNTTLYAKWIDYNLPSITVDNSKAIKLTIGKTTQLSATVNPEKDTDNIHWFVNSNYSNGSSYSTKGYEAITLTSAGLVTAMVAGRATVYAELNGVMSDLITIEVEDENVETKISVSPSKVTLGEGDETTVYASVTPSSKESSVSWKSKDSSIATVIGSGASATITGVAKGSTDITASVDGKTATVKVTVTEKVNPITLSATTLDLTANKDVTAELTATLAPEFAGKNVVWTSTDDTVAAVNAKDGTNTLVAIVDPADELEEEKTAVITATIEGTENKAECKVTVRPVGGAMAPYADIESGSAVKKGTLVNLFTDTPEAQIFYTTDGSEPATKEEGSTKLYKDAIEITGDVTIKAIAFKSDLKASAVSTFEYTVARDWGDIDENIQADIFGNDFDKVPEGVWYLIDGVKYEKEGATSYTATYNGDKITFNEKILVFHNTRKLSENRDYTLTFTNNVNAAKTTDTKAPTANIKGKGAYNSAVAFKFTIEPDDINNAAITSEKVVTVLSGKTKLSATKVVVSYNGKALANNKDYELKFFDADGKDASAAVLNDASKIYTIEVNGKGNFNETMTDTVTVKTLEKSKTVVQVSKLKVDAKALNKNYDGNPVDVVALFKEGKATVKEGSALLAYDVDYTVEPVDEDNTSAGKHSFVVKGIDKEELADGQKNYIGEKTVTYEIKGTAISKVKFNGFKTTVEYTGKAITLAEFGGANLTDKKTGAALVQGKDYEVVFTNNGAVGKFKVVYTGKAGYTGTVKKTVTVKARKIPATSLNITVNDNKDVTYIKSGAKPSVKVMFGDVELLQGVDFTVSYKGNTKISTGGKLASVVIKGAGNYAGTSATKTFKIVQADINQVTVVANDVVYKAKGKAGYFLVTPKLMDGGKALTVGKGKDVEKIDKSAYTYEDLSGKPITKDSKVEPGTTIVVSVPVTCDPTKSPYKAAAGTKLEGYYRVVAANAVNISKAKITGTDGKTLTLTVNNGEPVKVTKSDLKVVVGGRTLTADDYNIVSITNNTGVGNATLTIEGKGNYYGTKSQSVKIKAKGMK